MLQTSRKITQLQQKQQGYMVSKCQLENQQLLEGGEVKDLMSKVSLVTQQHA